MRLAATRKEESESTITISIVLKFFLHRKHRARLVFGLTAVLNSEQRGQRNLKYPSEYLWGMSRTSAMRRSMGMSFRSERKNCGEKSSVMGDLLKKIGIH